MKICLTVPSLDRDFGGPMTKSAGLKSALTDLGHEVTLIGCSETGDGLPVLFRFHSTPVPRTILPVIRAVRDSDIVHILGYRDPIGTVAAETAARNGIPYVIEPEGMYRPIERSFKLKRIYQGTFGRRVMSRASAVVAVSELEATQFKEEGVAETLVSLRPNGVDVEWLLPLPRRGAIRKRFEIPEKVQLVLSLGRISKQKRLDHLIAATSQIPDVWVLIAGPDAGDGGLQAVHGARTALSMEDRVIVADGGLWGPDKASAFADADCFCLPSASENFGIAILEAAACGLPVVVSDRCGSVEWLAPDSSIVIPVDDSLRLRKAISTVLTDTSYRDNALKRSVTLREKLRWDVLVARQLEIYETALARHNRDTRTTSSKTRKKREFHICLTVPSLSRDFGGPASKAVKMRAALEKLGHTVELVGCGTAPGATGLEILGHFHTNAIPRRAGPLKRAILRADIVHVLGYREPVSALATILAHRNKVPYIIEPVGTFRRWSRSFLIKNIFDSVAKRTTIPHARAFIATSRIERDTLTTAGVDPTKVFLRPNGIELSVDDLPVRTGKFRPLHRIPLEAKVVLSIGRIARTKDFPTLLDAVAGSPQLSDVWVVIAGPDEHDGTLENIVAKRRGLGLDDRVVVLPGGLWGAQKASAIADATCFCLPSSSESFGNAALEAAISGIPVVVSTGCGGREWLDETSSAVFRAGDTADLAAKLEQAMQPGVRKAALVTSETLRDTLSWTRVAAAQVEIYDRVLAS